jgi:hypothetical protein
MIRFEFNTKQHKTRTEFNSIADNKQYFFRIYNPNKGHMHVGFRSRFNIRYPLAVWVGWVEGRNPTSKLTMGTPSPNARHTSRARRAHPLPSREGRLDWGCIDFQIDRQLDAGSGLSST